jgi:sterol 3beta-glucosyltransferase
MAIRKDGRMKIAIVALGSRGDVQPYVALGRGLRAAGYDVCIVTHAIFEKFVTDAGLGFALVRLNPQDALQSNTGKAAAHSGNPISAIRNFLRLIDAALPEIFADVYTACQGCAAILSSPLGFYCAPHIAERLNIPLIHTYYLPIHPTKAFPSYLFATPQNRGALYNRLSHLPGNHIGWIPVLQTINRCRKGVLGLPPITPAQFNRIHLEHPMIYGYSPSVLPRPEDWGEKITVTGYWFLDHPEVWQPPRALVEFLEAGDKPIYVGFGSMNTQNAERTTAIILEALRQTGRRAVLSVGWGGLTQLQANDQLFPIESIPHDWLFPHMAAVIHHGGAGTTSAGLRAGVPSIIVPFYLDQPFWGYRVAQLGVGPMPIPQKALTAEKLVSAIRTALDTPEIGEQAAGLGIRIRAEDGIAQAVKRIETCLTK